MFVNNGTDFFKNRIFYLKYKLLKKIDVNEKKIKDNYLHYRKSINLIIFSKKRNSLF